MKKLFALLLALAMVLSLVACGSSSSSAPAPAEKEEPAAAEEEAPAEEPAAEEEAPAEEAATEDPYADPYAAADPYADPYANADPYADPYANADPYAQQAADDGESDLALIQDKGTLVVGITDFEPMDYKDADGNWIGFDADLATLFAESLGVSVEFQEIEWDDKLLELSGFAIDCIWNGMTLTDEVMSAASCSNPYMMNAQVVVLPADVAENYPDIESMSDLVFAVEAGSAGEDAVEELGYTTNPMLAQADALMEVKAGTSDAAVIDLLMAYAMTGEGTSYDTLTYTISLNAEEYGVAFRQGSDVADAFNAFLAEKYADGTLDQIAETYGLAGSVVAQ